ncbi:MAG: hypothetical protein Q8O67_25625 [Deltaproteobacteria bacterium]|nr:hypothetical protein [Deltaproteobacteria bacterium]
MRDQPDAMNSEMPASPSTFSMSPERLLPRDLASLQRDTWAVMKLHPAVFIGLPAAALGGVDVIASLGLPGYGSGIAQLVVMAWVSVMLLAAVKAVGNGATPTVRAILKEDGLSPILITTLTCNLLVGLACMFFLLPGIWLGTLWLLAIPAVYFEGKGAGAARTSSATLVRGRGTFRLLLWSQLTGLWLGLGYLCNFGGAVLFASDNAVVSLVVGVVFGVPLSVISGGLVIASGLLYLELVGTPLQHPVGLELRTKSGERLPAPLSTGRAGLGAIIAVGLAGLFLGGPFVAVKLWVNASPETAWDVLKDSPIAVSIFYGDDVPGEG